MEFSAIPWLPGLRLSQEDLTGILSKRLHCRGTSLVTRRILTAGLAFCAALTGVPAAFAQAPKEHASWQLIGDYCMDCHNSEDWAGSVAFDLLTPADIPAQAEIFETAIRKLRGGLMPPPGNERPDAGAIAATVAWLETTLDAAASAPDPGAVPLRRLNRREYAHAIRDLLGMEIDATALLPADDLEGGYDNNAAALQVSPAFIDQYLNAARTIAHQAVGDRRPIPI